MSHTSSGQPIVNTALNQHGAETAINHGWQSMSCAINGKCDSGKHFGEAADYWMGFQETRASQIRGKSQVVRNSERLNIPHPSSAYHGEGEGPSAHSFQHNQFRKSHACELVAHDKSTCDTVSSADLSHTTSNAKC